jgi:light-regulated signal transduction histidine kinase (bacteriophytochrome)
MKFRTSFGFQLTCLVLIIVLPAALVTAYDFASSLCDKRDSSYAYLQTVANKCAHDLDGLIQFSRVSRVELKRQMTDMDALLREVLVDYKIQIGTQGIEPPVHPLGYAACHRGALVHVFSNLIANAVKYTRSRPLPRIEIGCEEGAGENVYVFRDNGIGFDMKVADRLTQVFQKLHANYEGSGVGLAIVRRTVEKHGGKLWAVSVPGQGAAFFFSLPKTSPTMR